MVKNQHRRGDRHFGAATARFVRAAVVVLICASAATATAGPWADPGDQTLRQDVELLSDVGVIRAPITTWPLSWGELSRALSSATVKAGAPASWHRALQRLRRRASIETSWGITQVDYGVALADNPRRLRLFEDTPRANGEAFGSASYTGERISARAQVTIAANPDDDRNFRLDGSYVGIALGNTTINFGLQDKFWGPGWDGALALSNSARPIPGLLIQRNFSDPFQTALLSWLGPWNGSFFFGQLESGRGVPRARFVAARFSFKPFESLEIGLTRTAQWGGSGRDNGLDSFFDLVLGRDNIGDAGVTTESEPGNQMAGYDWRWRVIRGTRPIVFYGQLIGEDEAGGFPSRFLGQLGVSMSSPVGNRGASVRAYAEFADTTCQFYESSKLFDCAYNNRLYSSGYRYRGRPIGHSADADSRQVSVGASYLHESGARYSGSVRLAKLNRGGAASMTHSLSMQPSDLLNVEFSHERQLFGGRATVGVGVDRADGQAGGLDGNDVRAFLKWDTRI